MSRQKKETVELITVDKLMPFPNHPFLVKDDDMMRQLTESIRQLGVLVPAIVRPTADGRYQLISGHRRKHVCECLGISTMPVIVRNVDDDTAIVLMVDSNFQREVILPSERAKAYKMKLDAMKRQGRRNDLTSAQVGQKLAARTSREAIALHCPDSATQIQRYIRLNYLIPGLLNMVDEGKIALTPAVELSYLTTEEQRLLCLTIDSEQATPSLSQAQRMKQLSYAGCLTDDAILATMMEQKKPDCWNLTFPLTQLEGFFPDGYTPKQMEKVIFSLLERWSKARTEHSA